MADESPAPPGYAPAYRITDNVYAAMILAQAEAAEEAASAWVLAQEEGKGGGGEEPELPETRAANDAAAAAAGLDDDSLDLLLGAITCADDINHTSKRDLVAVISYIARVHGVDVRCHRDVLIRRADVQAVWRDSWAPIVVEPRIVHRTVPGEPDTRRAPAPREIHYK